MTAIDASYRETDTAFHVEGRERIDFSLHLVDGAFAIENEEIASSYRAAGRCLAVVDAEVHALYGAEIEAYFEHHGIDLTVFPVRIAETEKSLASLERIVDALGDFGLLRNEPVLVVGGGLTTDVAGFACSSYRRGTDYIRVPTTLIGLVDASVAIKVAVNHGHLKNRLGAYHAVEEDDPRLLLPAHAARGAGAQRDGGAGEDRDRRQRLGLRAAGAPRRGAAADPLRQPRRRRAACGRSPRRSTWTRSARCSTSRCRTCTSSTSTG